jgi:hypothetical protein
MDASPPDRRPPRRRSLALVTVGLLTIGLVAIWLVTTWLVTTWLVTTWSVTTWPGGTGGPDPRPAREGPPEQPPAVADDPPTGGWDVVAETVLASAPMLRLPEAAALPHALVEAPAEPPLALPAGRVSSGRVPAGFPATPEGAVAQLAALTEVGLAGGDPLHYRRAYEAVALPGAPPAETARLYRDLRRVRAGVSGLPRTGPVPGLEFRWTPTSALIKGSADGSRYLVVCVLGELVTGLNGRSLVTGAGDCQAFRRVADDWRISPGVPAAPAALAWPGSAEAVRAGYRAVQR